MKSTLSHIKTLKDLLFFLKNSNTDPSTFFRFFGKRSNSYFSILDPNLLISDIRKNIRFIQNLSSGRQGLPLIIFVNLNNPFLRRQLSFLSLKNKNITIKDINEVNSHNIFSETKGVFGCVSLFLTAELELQMSEQAYKRSIPVVYFRSPVSNERKGEGSVVSETNSYPAKFLIVHLLCLGLSSVQMAK